MNKQTEHDEQVLIFRWASLSTKKYPCLNFLHSSQNGMKMNIKQAVRAKRSGLIAGVPDIFLPYPHKGYAGLFIELKVGKNKTSASQKEFIAYLNSVGYLAHVCYGAGEAVRTIKEYLK